MAFRTAPLAILAWLVAGVAGGCGGKDTTTPTAGVRGESCLSSKDCGSGLACVDSVCSVRTFGLSKTQNECVAIYCRTAADCLPDGCAEFDRDCTLLGDTYACSQFEAQCLLDQYACEDDRCVTVCTASIDCSLGVCINGRCADCGTDDDCFETESCIENTCVTGCKEKADCPVFHDCEGGVCVDIGCANDRECIADKGSTRAVCQNKECVVPCETDIQCDEPFQYDFVSCIEGRCTPIGCASDTECRIYMNVADLGGDAECRPVTP